MRLDGRKGACEDFAESHFASGLTLASVLSAPALVFNRKDSLHDTFLKRLFGFQVDRYTKHYLPAPGALLSGVQEGVGYGLVPSVKVMADAEVDLLVDLAPSSPILVDLYWHHWAVEPPLARKLAELVVAAGSTSLLKRDGLPLSHRSGPTGKPHGQTHPAPGC